MKVKVLKRNSVFQNTITFSLMTPFFVYISRSILSESLVFSITELEAFANDNKLLFILSVITSVLIFRAKKVSLFAFAVLGLAGLGMMFWHFLSSFDKIILFLSFFYFILTFYFAQLLRLELSSPLYAPGFHFRDLMPRNLHQLPVEVVSRKTGQSVKGYLSNWSDEAFFLDLGENDLAPRLKGILDITFYFEGLEYYASGMVVTRSHGGIGVRIHEILRDSGNAEKRPSKNAPLLGWIDYYDIIVKRGYRPKHN